MDRYELLDLFDELTDDVLASLGSLSDWGLSGERPTQYRHDVIADSIILPRLVDAGLGVLSEESGVVAAGYGGVTVVVDPVDGSTNGARGLPWFATSLCAVDHDGPVAALVANLATGERFRAARGDGVEVTGAFRSVAADSAATVEIGMVGRGSVGAAGVRYQRGPGHSGCRTKGEAIIGVSGLPPGHGGWAQFRALGAAALDMCAVATGRLDGFVDIDRAHGVWDYLGAMLICLEAGAAVADSQGQELVVLDPTARRGPVAAATPELLTQLLAMVDGWLVDQRPSTDNR